MLEIGVYSGGSLELWQDYFGPRAQIYGVDIAPDCTSYEGPSVRIFIGDQADRDFWRRFRERVPKLDIVIDDGGHTPEQQRISVEELLPHLAPGGIYICEDIHGYPANSFASYAHGLAHILNDSRQVTENQNDEEARMAASPNPFQSAIRSIQFYPFMTVIEKNAELVSRLIAPKHGTLWQPFLD